MGYRNGTDRNILYEVMMAAPVAAACAALAVSCLFRTASAARDAMALDAGTVYAQDMAEAMAASHGDLSVLPDVFPEGIFSPDGSFTACFDEDMRPAEGRAAYCIELEPLPRDGLMGTAHIRLRRTEGGETLWSADVSWQETD